MTQKKTILFVCNEPNYNLYNRRSAIDSILCSVLNTLKGDYNVLVNGESFELPVLTESKAMASSSYGSIKSLLTKMLPMRLKEAIKMKRVLRHTDELYQTILDKNVSCDYVFELYKIGSDLGMKLAQKLSAEYIMYYDSPVVQQYEDIWKIKAPERQLLLDRQKQSVKAAQKIIVYSNPVKEFLEKMGADGEIKIFQTLDYSRLSGVQAAPHDGLNIGFIGSFMPWHRVDMLIEAFENFKKTGGEKSHLYLIGDGETRIQNEARANQSDFKDAITFTGFDDGGDLEHYKSILDIGVMPGSNWYGMPTKVFEYATSAIASIAPDTPTIADLFSHEENILLFKWDDQEALNKELSRLLIDSKLRKKIAQNVQSKVLSEITEINALNFYKNLFK